MGTIILGHLKGRASYPMHLARYLSVSLSWPGCPSPSALRWFLARINVELVWRHSPRGGKSTLTSGERPRGQCAGMMWWVAGRARSWASRQWKSCNDPSVSRRQRLRHHLRRRFPKPGTLPLAVLCFTKGPDPSVCIRRLLVVCFMGEGMTGRPPD